MFVRLYRRWLGALHNVKEVAMSIREWLVTFDPSYWSNGILNLCTDDRNSTTRLGDILQGIYLPKFKLPPI